VIVPARSHGADLLWLVAVAVIVPVGSWFTNLPEDHAAPSGYQPWLAAVLGVGAVAGLLSSLRWPLRGAAATYGAVTVFVALDLRDGPIYLCLAAAAFLVAARVRVRDWLRVVAAGTLAVCGALVLRAVAHYDNQRSLWQLAAVVAVVAAGAAIGTLTRAQAMTVVERARTAATQQQLRVAQELHDGVGHGLAVIAMQAGAALHVLDRDPEAARRNLEAIRAESKESLDLLRRQLARLTDTDTATGAGPAPRAPEHGLADLPALVERVRTGGLEVSLRLEVDSASAEAERAAYAVVQEGLTNVLRHAGATRAEVAIVSTPAAEMVVTVDDDGRGSDMLSGERRPGMGIVGMRSRVEALGGTLEAGPEVRGFRLRASLPLTGSSAGGAEGLA
jgi:signal transduction histidine kinase